MTSSRQTLCLCMIVKDEAPVIRRCLASVRTVIDHWIIVDTGSTDGTQAIILDALRDLPGTLHTRSWRDFAHNRSEALELARTHGDYTLIIDADDTLCLPEGFVLPSLQADAYTLDIADAGIVYRRPQIVRNALPWRYRGVLHEFLTCEDARIGALAVTMRRNHDGARRRDPHTYQRDAQVLERALTDEADPFLVARYTFYLAQSYRDCGELEKALRLYLTRAELGFWAEEVFVSLLCAGRLMERMGHNVEEILGTYRRASTACPSRAEAAHAASLLCRLNERFAEGCAAAAPALGLTPPADGLFVEPWIYAYGLRDEYAVNAYWAGLGRESLSACLDLLESGDLPEGYRTRIAANARFALERLSNPPQAATKPTLRQPTAELDPSPAAYQTQPPQMPEGVSIEDIVGLSTGSICIADVGAADLGQRPIYDRLLNRGLARLVAFEPDEREVAPLRAALGPDTTIIPRALGDGQRHQLHLGPPGSGMTSLLKPDRDYLAYFNGFPSFGQVVGTQEIATTRLDDCAEVNAIDFIRLDVQGSELPILRHGTKKLQDCVFIQLEVSFITLYEQQNTFGEIDIYMRQQGYIPHCFAEIKHWSIAPTIREGNFRVPFNQLLEGDIVYVKNLVKNNIGDLSLKKIAIIAHYCYESPDLAAKCIIMLAERGVVARDAVEQYYRSLTHARV